jgi:hypothetical protein
VVRRRAWGEGERDLLRLPLDGAPRGVRVDRRAAHHVAHDVAARGERRQQCLVDLADQCLEVAEHDAVELDRLPGRETNGSVAEAPREPVEHEVLLRGHHAARDAASHHAGVGALGLALALRRPRIAVVLLVDPVVLDDVQVGVGELRRVGIGKGLGEMAAQVFAVLLLRLDLGGFLGSTPRSRALVPAGVVSHPITRFLRVK